MPRPTWLAYGFAVIMVAVSMYCIGRLLLASRLGRRNHFAVNVAHVLMGLAMTGMLVPRWNFLPSVFWETMFAAIAIYFLAMSIRLIAARGVMGAEDDQMHHVSHHLIHMVMACAMLYMYWLGMPITVPSGASMSMSGPPTAAGDPMLTLLLIATLLASAIWQLDSIDRYSPVRQLLLTTGHGTDAGRATDLAVVGEHRPWLAPRLEVLCHIVMCLTMGYMLVLMV